MIEDKHSSPWQSTRNQQTGLLSALSQSSTDSLVSSLAHSEDELSSDTEVYCICRKQSDGLMIQCEDCMEWFHTSCVGIKNKIPPSWSCGKCKPKIDDNTAAQLLLMLCENTNDKESDSDESHEPYHSDQSPIQSPTTFTVDSVIKEMKEQGFVPFKRNIGVDLLVSPRIPQPTRPEPNINSSVVTQIKHEPVHDHYIPTSIIRASPPSAPSPASIRSRKRKNEGQMSVLMRYYEQNPDPDLALKKRIAEETTLSVKQVSDWFYNLRVRKKFKNK